MKKTLISALICVPLFTGCVSTSDDAAATLDRNQAVSELTVKMDELGYSPVTIQPGVDEFLNMAAAILERQRNVIGEYRKQTENYTDVQAFLYSYRGATPEALQLAIDKFDAGAKTEDEKIGHKIDVYTKANENVYDQNIELTTTLALEIAESAYILSEHSTEVAKATAANLGGSVFGSLLSDEKEEDPKDLGNALLKAKDQLSLALEANDIIDLELATIDAVKQLQQEQEAKS
ncbi:hypothetical protein L2729_16230 [Shewanella gelidimarina]|uniref:hypothetical protein n=1 Tax=Shewanella gelidimarina TaxID=56813 RepID=UPI00200C1259|nr:hypothetical protein [Shewanella gelidimarina]MCL1059520.1 hypothetical protein [Shewanella gelidimarina]